MTCLGIPPPSTSFTSKCADFVSAKLLIGAFVRLMSWFKTVSNIGGKKDPNWARICAKDWTKPTN